MKGIKKRWTAIWKDERGIGTVEMILILVENQRYPNLMCFV